MGTSSQEVGRKIGKIDYLNTGAAEDANVGSGPGDVGVEVIEELPRFTARQEARHVYDVASISKIEPCLFRRLSSFTIWRAFLTCAERFESEAHRRFTQLSRGIDEGERIQFQRQAGVLR